MKTFTLALAFSLGVFGAVVNLNARIVTLTIGGSRTNASLTIGTNELVTILAGKDNPYGSYVIIQKDGMELEGSYRLGVFDPLDSNGVKFPPKIVIAGPAILKLTGPNFNPGFAFLTVEIQPDLFPPDKTLVVPQGSGANIILESSTNLVNWSPVPPGLYTNQTANTFFRLRADHIP